MKNKTHNHNGNNLNNEKEKHRLQLFWIGVVDTIVEKCGEFLNVKNGKAKQEGGFHECSLAREGISFQWNCFQGTQEHFWNGFPLICLFSDYLKNKKTLFTWNIFSENMGALPKWLPFNFLVFR